MDYGAIATGNRLFRFAARSTTLIHHRFAAVPLTNYGIAATGSYNLLDSLRDAPPRRGRFWGVQLL